MNTCEPLVTVAIATYNGEKYIVEQIESILAQSYKNIEILVADDCSTDATFAILQSYASRYPGIVISRNHKRLGWVKNFEQLLKRSKGEYIAFSDQDDLWLPGKLSTAIEALEREDPSKPLMFHSDLEVCSENMQRVHHSYFEMCSYTFSKEKQLDAMLGRCGVMGNTMVINQRLKSLALPFPEGLAAHDYWIALLNELYGKRVTYAKCLVRYRLHGSNTSNTADLIRGRQHFLSILSREKTKLPFEKSNRVKVLHMLLDRYPMNDENKRVVLCFIDYLQFKKSRLYLLSLLFKYNFLRDSLSYRVKIAMKMIWKSR